MAADEVGGLVPHILDDRVTRSLDFPPDRGLEIRRRNKMGTVRHHIKLRIAGVPHSREVVFGSGALVLGPASDEEDGNVQRSRLAKNL